MALHLQRDAPGRRFTLLARQGTSPRTQLGAQELARSRALASVVGQDNAWIGAALKTAPVLAQH